MVHFTVIAQRQIVYEYLCLARTGDGSDLTALRVSYS